MFVKPTEPQPLPPGSELPTAEPARPELTVESSRRGPFVVVKMTGRLHAATVTAAEAEILSTIVLAPPSPRLVLDLTEVTSIDSHGVRLLAKTRFAAHAVRGTLHVIAPDDSPAHRVPHLNVLSTPPQAEDLADVCPSPAPDRPMTVADGSAARQDRRGSTP